MLKLTLWAAAQLLKKLNTKPPTIPRLGTFPKELKTEPRRDIRTPTFTAAWSRQPGSGNDPSVYRRMNGWQSVVEPEDGI